MLAAVLILAIVQQPHYRLTPRDTLRYRELTESHIVLRFPAESVAIATQHDGTIALVGVHGDTLTAWYEQLMLSSTSPRGENRPNTDGALRLPFRLVLPSNGHVTLLEAPTFPAEIAAQSDLTHQFEDFFISLPAAALRPNAAWADTVENAKAGSPGDTYQAKHIRRYRVLRDTVAAGGVAAVVISVEQDLTVHATSPLASQSATVVTQLHGSEEGTAVFAPGVARLISRDRRARLEGDQTLEQGARRMVVPVHYEYSSTLALVR